MAVSRGYSSYRGRSPKWKIILAVVLVLVILAALGVMTMQKYIVYGEDGRPRLELPWQEPETPPEDPGALDITIEKTEKTPELQILQVEEAPLADWTAREEALALSPVHYSAVALTMKDSGGTVYFDAKTPDAPVKTAAATAGALAELLAADRPAIARLACFRDSRTARSHVEEMGLKNTGGFIFYDGNSENWLDPGKPAARQYLCALAAELAAMGFDEILLTDVTYPTEGKLDKIDYGQTMKAQNLMTFLEEMRAALEPYGAALSVELPEAVVRDGSDNIAGLLLADVAPRVDRVYAVTTADRVPALSAAVAAAGKDTDFVPEFPADSRESAGGNFLHLAN